MNVLQVLGGFAAIVISLAYGALVSGWAMSMIWGWFVTPVFALPALTILQAYGLMLVARLFQYLPATEKKEGKTFGQIIGAGMAKNTAVAFLVVGVGYIVKAFV